ncbi:related to human and mouse neutral sphingomyelinase [Cephalotrichum gorgonifer]|uniref:Related to human and mouse neutral sphingomyelinase n=1 Tax=Cephalotrichum gorgonifer TaxID=2041049 RepID=A0AAE8MRL5_9PEZI|nr:related to human and mouse neutral sphingomyelinase [Cephalotrichum gorgonifer]
MDSRPPEINVVTLNVWGLKHISKLRTERIAEIAHRLAEANPQPHIVALQELFCAADYRAIRHETRAVLPYGKHYYGGAFGSGLAILSRWPIEETSMFAYPLNGRPTAFWRGDWYVGKGVACAKIRFGPGRRDVVEVFNTHLHARYSSDKDNSYDCHRAAQAWEYARLLRGAADRGHLVLGLGDLNMLPLSLPHTIITSHAPVRDAWRVLHPNSSLGPAHYAPEAARGVPVPTAEFNIRENGATSDGCYNTWRWSPAQQRLAAQGHEAAVVSPDAIDEAGKRLDYILIGTGDVAASDGAGWVVKDVRVGMLEPHPSLRCSVSDHFSAEATLVFHVPSSSPRPASRASDSEAVNSGAYLQTNSPVPSDAPSEPFTAQLRAATLAPDDLTPSAYDEVLSLISSYSARERSQRRLRAYHFLASLGAWLACLVGTWFTPPFASFLLLLVGSLSLVAGTVDGLIALLFVGSELRALKEFEWEVLNARCGGEHEYSPARDTPPTTDKGRRA